jgi:hypothetical protein
VLGRGVGCAAEVGFTRLGGGEVGLSDGEEVCVEAGREG